jgi:hypothetical protein
MDHHLLCSWLGLPADSWPPNHYVLLGLKPGELDAAAVEASVHERMAILRRYQLTHPELATEAMNRLAQAMICLTDETSRSAYASELSPSVEVATTVESEAAISAPAVAGTNEPATGSAQPIPPAIEPESKPSPPLPPPMAEELHAVHTRRELYFRIARTRQIQHLWGRVGRYLNSPHRRLTKPSEATELIQHTQALPVLIQSFPSRLGLAGQPGYLVLALARQQLIVPTLQTLLHSQRIALARDWEAGQKFLVEQYKLLRSQSRLLRRRTPRDHMVRVTRSVLNNHPGLVVLSLSLLALNVALPAFRQQWLLQLPVLLGLVVTRFIVWWARSRPVELPIRERSDAPARKRRRQRDQLSSRRANR